MAHGTTGGESSFGGERRGRKAWGGKAICFMFCHIPGPSALFGSTRGRKCVMLSDNRGRKPRDGSIQLGDNIKSGQLALLFTVRDVTAS